MYIIHNSRDIKYRKPCGAAEVSTSVRLSLYAPEASRSVLHTWNKYEGDCAIEMKRSSSMEAGQEAQTNLEIGSKSELEKRSGVEISQEALKRADVPTIPEKQISSRPEEGVFEAIIKTPENGCLIWYYFMVYDADGVCTFYGNAFDGMGGEGACYEKDPKAFQITVYKKTITPEWYKNAVVYQIFPDRFAPDQEKFDKDAVYGESSPLPEDWYKTPHYEKDEKGNVTSWEFFGGTLNGIRAKLPYLLSLGVTAIYLNPIFKAVSNHRYDTADYFTIDPKLGTEADFKELCREAEASGISIILDGVFSHTGADSIYFDKYGRNGNGAFKNEHSPYRKWYYFTPDKEPGYECWWGVTDLPKVNKLDPSYRDFICGKDGVIQHWLNAGARGFRLDVADELPDEFIKEIRKAVKDCGEDKLLIGEVWEDASNKISYGVQREYFNGEELDGVMNYPLRKMILDFLTGKGDGYLTSRKMENLMENYPHENFMGGLDIIGSHDRKRIMTVLGAEQDRELARRRLKLAAALQYACPGVPCIYYGDETSLTGGADPENRGAYPWGREDLDMVYHYRMLGLIYREHPVLKDGAYENVKGVIPRNIYTFKRVNKEERILVVANASVSETTHVKIDEKAGYGLELLTSTIIKSVGAETRGDIAGKPQIKEETWSIQYGEPEKNPESVQGIKSDECCCDMNSGLEFDIPPVTCMLIYLKDEPPERLELLRAAGIICPIFSIPATKVKTRTEGEKGTMGKDARCFVDYIASAGFKLWQILPLNPVGMGNSPYLSPAVFAGEPSYIDRNELPDAKGVEKFKEENAYWLNDYVRFRLSAESDEEDIERINQACDISRESWIRKDKIARDKESSNTSVKPSREAGKEYKKKTAEELIYEQYAFDCQWQALKKYANDKGISIIGDAPLYVDPEGADVLAHPEAFMLDSKGRLKAHAGVPPDYFCKTGQDWGNPLYDWERMKADGYKWWIERLKHCAKMYDYVRLDHFRAFSAYFEVPQNGKPKDGYWIPGPGRGFFDILRRECPGLKLIAEDLGLLDPGVFNLLKLEGVPGMNVWQFSADEMRQMPDEVQKTRIFYSGTHDNQTLVGWCEAKAKDTGSEAYNDADNIIGELYKSTSPWVIIQLQDMLSLGDEARINIPGTVGENNWTWRADAAALTPEKAAKYKNLAKHSKRM